MLSLCKGFRSWSNTYSKFCNTSLLQGRSQCLKPNVKANPLCQPQRWTVTYLTAPEVPESIAASQKWVGRWLLTCSGMVFGTVLLGGTTRITKSGLSMVDWHLFKELPPLGEQQWKAEFKKYQEFPEYKHQNQEMTLKEFKFIWWMEYIHRTWGRMVGAAFYLPATYFWWKGAFTSAMKKRVVAFGLLLGFQGLLGWYMVKSGLEEKETHDHRVRVSQYRLAAHLGTAFIFYTLLLWSSLNHLWPPQKTPYTKSMRTFWKCAHGTKSLIFLAAFSGAFVAGLDAGLIYNSFPKMADKWIPTDLMSLEPKLRNFTENPTTVQFDHRILGEGVFCAVSAMWLFSRRLPLPVRARNAMNLMMALGVIQVALGITTLLLYVPKPVAVSHQAGALALLSSAVWLTHELKLLRHIPK